MTTEIDAEGLAVLIARAEDFIAHPNVHFHYKDGPEVMQGLVDALNATTRTSEAEPVAGCTCQKCGRVYIGDLLVPDDVWAQISPVPVGGDKGGGLLCATCIVDGIVSAGIATVVFTLPTPASDDQVEAVTDEGVLKAAIAIKRVFYERMDLGPEGDKELTLLDAAHLARAALLAAMGSTKP